MGRASKQKGAAFERWVCRELSQWVSAGKRDDLFWRSAMSGGRASLAEKKGLTRSAQCGDITAIDSLGEHLMGLFLIECKSYRRLGILEWLLYCRRSAVAAKAWTKLVAAARVNDRYPMLIMKENGRPPMCAVPLVGPKVSSRGPCIRSSWADVALYRLGDITATCFSSLHFGDGKWEWAPL